MWLPSAASDLPCQYGHLDEVLFNLQVAFKILGFGGTNDQGLGSARYLLRSIRAGKGNMQQLVLLQKSIDFIFI